MIAKESIARARITRKEIGECHLFDPDIEGFDSTFKLRKVMRSEIKAAEAEGIAELDRLGGVMIVGEDAVTYALEDVIAALWVIRSMPGDVRCELIDMLTVMCVSDPCHEAVHVASGVVYESAYPPAAKDGDEGKGDEENPLGTSGQGSPPG